MAAVAWTTSARDDLQYIHDFIARDSPRAALAVAEGILASAERLEFFPESGRVLPELPTQGYREIIVGNYRVIYRHDQNHVWIMAVVHGRRLLPDEALRR